MIRTIDGHTPTLGRGVFLAETCAVIGDTVIGDESSVWYSTVLRGDVMPIRTAPSATPPSFMRARSKMIV